jgi:hypothetical protein
MFSAFNTIRVRFVAFYSPLGALTHQNCEMEARCYSLTQKSGTSLAMHDSLCESFRRDTIHRPPRFCILQQCADVSQGKRLNRLPRLRLHRHERPILDGYRVSPEISEVFLPRRARCGCQLLRHLEQSTLIQHDGCTKSLHRGKKFSESISRS